MTRTVESDEAFLRAKGYDGLYCEECSCAVGDLWPCGTRPTGCRPGYTVPCPDECPTGCRSMDPTATHIGPKSLRGLSERA